MPVSSTSLIARLLKPALLATAVALSATPLAHADTATAPSKQKAAKAHAKAPESESRLVSAFHALSDAQLEIAKRVFTGRTKCEHGQSVDVEAIQDHPGFFHVAFNGAHFTMAPEETSSGAVRLFDRNAGVIWLQIPVKSMLMNQKQGHRMIDDCKVPEQAAAVQTASASLTAP
jgi:hypothetical protein